MSPEDFAESEYEMRKQEVLSDTEDMKIHNIRMNTFDKPGHLVNFKTIFNPQDRQFKVSFLAEGQRHYQSMTPEEYEAWCATLDQGITIDGWTMNFEGAGPEDKTVVAIRTYFHAVLQSYKEAKAAGRI